MPREKNIGVDILSGCVGEILFWAILIIVIAIGFWWWMASAIALVTAGALMYAWDRSLRKYRCQQCFAEWSFLDVKNAAIEK